MKMNNKPKWLALIVAGGIVLEVVGVLDLLVLSFATHGFVTGLVETPYYAGWLAIVVFLYLQLGRCRNWARIAVVIYASAHALVMPWAFFEISTIVIACIALPFNLFVWIYLMKSSTRLFFTQRGRMPRLLGLGGVVYVFIWICTLLFAFGTAKFGEFIDYDKLESLVYGEIDVETASDMKGLLTPKGEEQLEKIHADMNRSAEELFRLRMPNSYWMPDSDSFEHFHYGVAHAESFNHFVVLIRPLTTHPVDVADAVAMIEGDEDLKRIYRGNSKLKFGRERTISIGEHSAQVLPVKYKSSKPGILGLTETADGAVIFIAIPTEDKSLDIDSLEWLFEQ